MIKRCSIRALCHPGTCFKTLLLLGLVGSLVTMLAACTKASPVRSCQTLLAELTEVRSIDETYQGDASRPYSEEVFGKDTLPADAHDQAMQRAERDLSAEAECNPGAALVP